MSNDPNRDETPMKHVPPSDASPVRPESGKIQRLQTACGACLCCLPASLLIAATGAYGWAAALALTGVSGIFLCRHMVRNAEQKARRQREAPVTNSTSTKSEDFLSPAPQKSNAWGKFSLGVAVGVVLAWPIDDPATPEKPQTRLTRFWEVAFRPPGPRPEAALPPRARRASRPMPAAQAVVSHPPQRTLAYWNATVASLHLFRFGEEAERDAVYGLTPEQAFAQFEAIHRKALAEPTQEVDPELLAIVQRHGRWDQEFFALVARLRGLSGGGGAAPVQYDEQDIERLVEQYHALSDAEFAQLPKPVQDALHALVQYFENFDAQLREIEIMQAKLSERYKPLVFPLPALADRQPVSQ